jgi:DNA-binding winged helix-turn-helix (wHTH) protein
VGPLQVDLHGFQVFLQGQTIPLTRVEFDLLHHMVAHAHRLVTVQELVSFVIQGVHRPESSLIRVHMCHLRRKLGRAGAAITTVRGRGFRFDVRYIDADVAPTGERPAITRPGSTGHFRSSKLLRSELGAIDLASHE